MLCQKGWDKLSIKHHLFYSVREDIYKTEDFFFRSNEYYGEHYKTFNPFLVFFKVK